MIDLGVSKLALIAVVALVVVGPERLPKVARMAGNLFSRAQRYMAEVKAEVNRQMEVEEFKKFREEKNTAEAVKAADAALIGKEKSVDAVGSVETLFKGRGGVPLCSCVYSTQ